MTIPEASGASTSPVQPVRLGIVGLGMAGAVMVRAALGHPHVVCAGVAETNDMLRDRFARDHDLPVVADLQDLLESPAIEAVYLATPHQFHRQHAIAACEAGKHVIVEKPMALSLDDCDAMIAAAAACGVWLIVGHTHSFDPAIKAMRRLIQAGDIGRLSMIASLNYTDFLYRPRRPEELDTALGGGTLFNQVPHQVDLIRFLADANVRTVRAITNVLDPSRPTEGGCMALLEFDNGVGASLVYSGYDRFDSDEFHGWINEIGYHKSPAHGSARRNLKTLGDWEAEKRARSERGYGFAPLDLPPPHQPHFGITVVTCERGDLKQSPRGVLLYSDEGVLEIEIEPSPGWPGHGDVLEELYRAVRLGEPPAHSGAFGRGTVEVCLAILRSARERREVRLDVDCAVAPS